MRSLGDFELFGSIKGSIACTAGLNCLHLTASLGSLAAGSYLAEHGYVIDTLSSDVSTLLLQGVPGYWFLIALWVCLRGALFNLEPDIPALPGPGRQGESIHMTTALLCRPVLPIKVIKALAFFLCVSIVLSMALFAPTYLLWIGSGVITTVLVWAIVLGARSAHTEPVQE